ncbi:MAG: tRNA lysidine(34) synthetase TilS [Blastocatellia bacterium]
MNPTTPGGGRTQLEKKLRAALRRLHIGAHSRVLVAVSGGADSTALLHALTRLRGAAKTPQHIFAAHLNHMLRGTESDADEAFVSELAAHWNIPIITGHADVAQLAITAKDNLEAVARRERYVFLRLAAAQFSSDVVMTAHTRNDQVETILMRVLRGTGAAGLRGIHREQQISDGLRLARPLLDVTREMVLAHCAQCGLSYRTDSTNLLTDLTRNRVRLELMPALRDYNPEFDAALLRLAGQAAEDGDYLDAAAATLLTQCLTEEMALRIKPLAAAHPAIRKRALRLWIAAVRGDLSRIDTAHLLSVEHLLLRSENERYVELPGHARVWRRQGKLWWSCFDEQNAIERALLDTP